VPRGENGSGSPIEGYVDEDAVTDRDPGAMDIRNWRQWHGLRDAVPYLIRILDLCVENTSPLGSMSIRSKYPLQLNSLVPNARRKGERFSNSRWPGHNPDARKRRRTCVLLRSILRIGNHTKVRQGR
jgi:hypothetical protein